MSKAIITVSGPVTITFGSGQTYRVVTNDGSPVRAGEIKPGQFVAIDDSAGKLRIDQRNQRNRHERRKAAAMARGARNGRSA